MESDDRDRLMMIIKDTFIDPGLPFHVVNQLIMGRLDELGIDPVTHTVSWGDLAEAGVDVRM